MGQGACGPVHAARCMRYDACNTIHTRGTCGAAHATRGTRHGACGTVHAARRRRHGACGPAHKARCMRQGACGKVHAARCIRHGAWLRHGACGTVHGGTAHAARCIQRNAHGTANMPRYIPRSVHVAVHTARCTGKPDDCQTGRATAKGKADLPLQSQVMGRPGGNKGDGLDGSPGSQLARAGSCTGIEAGLGSRPATSAFCTWPLLSSERAMAPVARRGITYCARLRVEDKRVEAKRLLL